ncbi:MAG: DMT family transporter [Alkalilacustris sp.]
MPYARRQLEDPRPVTGILWMLLTGVCFVGVTGIVKHVGQDMPAAQAAFLRFVLGLVFLLPVLPALMRLRPSRTDWALFGGRSVLHVIGVVLWFFAMSRISIAEVTAMNYLAPVYVTIGAALFLGERLAARRLLAVAAGLAGALIILRPGFREISPGHLAMLGTALSFGISYLLAKLLSERFEAGLVVAMLSVTVTIGLAPLAWMVWVPPTAVQLGWLFLVAAFATAGHYAMTRAFAVAPVTVTQPVTFLQLVWATLLGLFVFAEPIDGWVILGGALILSAVSFITWREHVLKRRQMTPHPEATKL